MIGFGAVASGCRKFFVRDVVAIAGFGRAGAGWAGAGLALAVTGLVSMLVATPVLAAADDCPPEIQVREFVADWLAKTPYDPPFGVGRTVEAALCAQKMVLAALEPTLGPPVGYKAAATSKTVQERLKATGPVLGVLLRDMMLADGAEVPATYGAAPVFEADMVLVVGDAAINDAGTPEEALAHVRAMRPFIELADLTTRHPQVMEMGALIAIDAGARLGVLGEETPLDTSPAGVAALAAMTVTMTDGDGNVLAKADGSTLMGNPLNALLWVIGEVKARGGALQPGDLVSLGAFSPLTPPKPGLIVNVAYGGLQGDPEVTVTFADE